MGRYKMTSSMGMILLGIWLIMTGLIPLLHLSFEGLPLIMAILAIVSGIFISAVAFCDSPCLVLHPATTMIIMTNVTNCISLFNQNTPFTYLLFEFLTIN